MFKIISINNELTCYSIDEYGNVINNKTNRILKGSITRSGYHYYRFSIKKRFLIILFNPQNQIELWHFGEL